MKAPILLDFSFWVNILLILCILPNTSCDEFGILGKDGKSGAHSRYAKPGDLLTEDARKEMANLMNIKSSDERLQRYRDVCARFPPVFRHFFLEQYSTPSIWFEKRLTYTRSAAASSMVGYILGLGDRHLQNILIDEHTAELVITSIFFLQLPLFSFYDFIIIADSY